MYDDIIAMYIPYTIHLAYIIHIFSFRVRLIAWQIELINFFDQGQP